MPETPSAVTARTTSPADIHTWSAREPGPHWRTSRATVVTASSAPPVSSATRSDGASNEDRHQGTATPPNVTGAAPAAASDTVSAGFRAGPCSIVSTLRTSEPSRTSTGTGALRARRFSAAFGGPAGRSFRHGGRDAPAGRGVLALRSRNPRVLPG